LKFAHICPKQALKYTIFVNIQKRPKNGQMAEHYFWQTVSKRPNGNPGTNVLFNKVSTHHVTKLMQFVTKLEPKEPDMAVTSLLSMKSQVSVTLTQILVQIFNLGTETQF
jgi:hypothetical protein